MKFFFAWLLTYWINIWVTYILNNFFQLSKDIAYFIAISLVTIVNFIISMTFTFSNKYSHKLLIKYVAVLIFFSILNYIIVYIVKFLFPVNYYVLIFVITTFIFFAKFVVYDKYVFNHKKKINLPL